MVDSGTDGALVDARVKAVWRKLISGVAEPGE
jgi:hypothetical protein